MFRLTILFALAFGLLFPLNARAQCDCKPCRCEVCPCGFVSTQEKIDTPREKTAVQHKTLKVTCKSGYVVEFAWHEKHRMYCPCEPGWTFSPDSGLWIPPVQAPTPSLYPTLTGGRELQGGSCTNGQCSPSGRGFFRRR